MAVLTVTIKEEVTLNGSLKTFENVHTETVDDIFHRIYGVLHTAESELLNFSTADAGGVFSDADLDYLRITNLDSTNFITVRVLGNSEEYFVKIEAGDSLILNNSIMDANATGSQSFSSGNIDSIKAQADSATVNVEILALA
tara:strand:+ start:278 stop:703 length:426 start_codon:yes stop_codon:yes gene_type:complete